VPRCGDKVTSSHELRQQSPVPWYGSVIVIILGIICCCQGAGVPIAGLDEAGRALVYIPLGNLFGMTLRSRVASYELTDNWHTLIRHRPTMLSLDNADDFDGDKTELLEFLADDNTVDLDLRLDARRFLRGCPRRLVQIAYKRYSGIPLTDKEWHYLKYQRQRELKKSQKLIGF